MNCHELALGMRMGGFRRKEGEERSRRGQGGGAKAYCFYLEIEFKHECAQTKDG